MHPYLRLEKNIKTFLQKLKKAGDVHDKLLDEVFLDQSVTEDTDTYQASESAPSSTCQPPDRSTDDHRESDGVDIADTPTNPVTTSTHMVSEPEVNQTDESN